MKCTLVLMIAYVSTAGTRKLMFRRSQIPVRSDPANSPNDDFGLFAPDVSAYFEMIDYKKDCERRMKIFSLHFWDQFLHKMMELGVYDSETEDAPNFLSPENEDNGFTCRGMT